MTLSRSCEKSKAERPVKKLDPHDVERIIEWSLFIILFIFLLSVGVFFFFAKSMDIDFAKSNIVDRSQIASTILTFGAFVGAAFIPIWQFFVAGRVSRVERTISFWEAHRSDGTFRLKRRIVRNNCNSNSNIITMKSKPELLYQVQDFCKFYERLGRGVRKMYYDKKEAKELFGQRLVDDYEIAKLYIEHRIKEQATYYQDFVWLVKEWNDIPLTDRSSSKKLFVDVRR
jgi:hypothetical protein